MAKIVIKIFRFMHGDKIHSCESSARNDGFRNHTFCDQKVNGSYKILARQLACVLNKKIKATDIVTFIYEQEIFSVQHGKDGEHLVHSPLAAEEVQLFVKAYESERLKQR